MVATESRMRAWTLALFSIALCATRFAEAALTEEKIQLSNTGNLHYQSLSDDEKLDLFQKYESDSQRLVRDSDENIVCACNY